MKKDERIVLIKNKRSDGKQYNQIYKEINCLEDSQKLFKENKLEITRLSKEVNKLKIENAKLRNKSFNVGLGNINNSKPVKTNRQTIVPTVKDLNRIIMVLKSEEKPMTATQVRKIGYGLNYDKIKPCIVFLLKYNIIKLEDGLYSLK